MKRILTLDGGGIRGVFTLQVLARIEALFQEQQNNGSLVLADVFDLIAGTSTGAIIAALLSWGLSVREIQAIYLRYAPLMFAVGSWHQRWKYKYDARAIAAALKSVFSETPDGKTPALLGSSKLRTLLLIIMRNGSTGSAWPVCNHPLAKYNDRALPDCNLDFPLWQLIRASTAAPTFFMPEEIKIGGKTHLFMDGALTPYNNPALIAILTATLPSYRIGWPATRRDLHVISVGTGLTRARMPGKAAADIHLLDHIRYIAPALIGSVAWEQDALCRVLGDCVHGAELDSEIGALDVPTLLGRTEQKFTYARYDELLDPRHPKLQGLKTLALDDVKLIPMLQDLGQDYALKHVHPEHFHPRPG